MANNTITQKIALTGGDDIQKQLQNIGDAGAKAFGAVKDAATGVASALNPAAAAVDKTKDSLDGATDASTKFLDGLKKVGGGLNDAVNSFSHFAQGVELAVGALATGLLAISKRAFDVVQSQKEQAQSLGITTEAYGKMQFALSQSGLDLDRARAAFNNLNKSINDTRNAAPGTVTALGKLGISVNDTSGGIKTADVILTELADHFQKLPDGAEKSALAIELFGKRAGPQLIPLLNEGTAGIEEMNKQAIALGVVFGKTETGITEGFDRAGARLAAAASGITTRIGLAFLPLFTRLADALTELLEKNGPLVLDTINGIAAALTKLIDSVIVPAFAAVGRALDFLATKINEVFGSHLSGSNIAFILITTNAIALFLKLGAAVASIIPGIGALGGILAPIVTLFTSLTGVIGRLVLSFAPFLAGLGSLPVLLVVAAAAIAALIVVLANLSAQFLESFGPQIWQQIVDSANAAWKAIQDGAQAAVTFITDTWTGIIQFFTDTWASIVQLATDAAAAIAGGFNTVVSSIGNAFSSLSDRVLGFINPIIDALGKLVDVARQAAQALSGVNGSGGDGGGQGFAGGGAVRGPGTSRSDSIPAWLSNNEFVMQAKAVRKFGVGFMHAINQGQLPKFNMGGLVAALGNMPRFADGGLVGMPSLAPSTGGGISGRPVNLNIGGQTFHLVAPEEVAGKLISFATEQNTKRAGRAPQWKG